CPAHGPGFENLVGPRCRAPHRVIDGPPQPAPLPVDHQTEFIEMPDVRAGTARPSQASRVLQPEPYGPEADGFVRDLNSKGQQQRGHVSEAHSEPVIQPNSMADDLGWKPKAFVDRWAGQRLGHGRIRPDHQRLDNAINKPRAHGADDSGGSASTSPNRSGGSLENEGETGRG